MRELIAELMVRDEAVHIPQRVENFLEGLRSAGYRIVPLDPFEMECEATKEWVMKMAKEIASAS